MKTWLALVFLSTLIGFVQGTAAASPQTDDCGDNVPSVNQVINSKFLGVFRANYVDSFVGTWGQGFVPLVISAQGTFNFYGYDFIACPQQDGSIYVYKVGDPKEGGFLKLQSSKQLTVFGGTGMVSVANGSYPKAK